MIFHLNFCPQKVTFRSPSLLRFFSSLPQGEVYEREKRSVSPLPIILSRYPYYINRQGGAKIYQLSLSKLSLSVSQVGGSEEVGTMSLSRQFFFDGVPKVFIDQNKLITNHDRVFKAISRSYYSIISGCNIIDSSQAN